MRPMSHSPFSHFLGGGNSNIFYFHPYLGKIPILTNIFRRSWNTNQLCVGRNFICCENNSGDKTGQSLKLSPHFLWHQTPNSLLEIATFSPVIWNGGGYPRGDCGIFFSLQSPQLKPLTSRVAKSLGNSLAAKQPLQIWGRFLKCSTFSLWGPCAFLLKKMYYGKWDTSQMGFCPWVKREVVFHNLPVFVFWNFVPRNLTWNLKMMVSKRNLRTSRDFSSGSMLNFGGTKFPNLTVLSLPPLPEAQIKRQPSFSSSREPTWNWQCLGRTGDWRGCLAPPSRSNWCERYAPKKKKVGVFFWFQGNKLLDIFGHLEGSKETL